MTWARLAGVTRPAVNLFYCTGLALGLGLALAPRAEAAGPYYVALSGSGGNGLSWGTAFTNMQTAIDAAADGETIYLKGETFTLPTNNANGKLVWSGKGLTILGGYAANGGAPGALTSTPTVLLNTGAAYSNLYRVLYISGVTNGTLRRLTIKGGAVGNGNPQWDYRPYYGAGIYMKASSNMVLDTVTLDGNFLGGQQGAEAFGGAMYAAADTYGVLTNCTVRNSSIQTHYNTCNYGAGLYLAGGAWSIVDSVVRDNLIFSAGHTATVRGIGVYVAGGTHLIRNCAISRNTVTGNTPQGDAVYVADGTANIVNCTVYWQQTEGIRQAGGTVTVKDSIVWDNGDDIAGTITLQNNDIEDGDSVNVNGNISANPQFERGFYLATNSPCVNAGSRSASAAGLDGRPTRADGAGDAGTVDLGYHFASGAAVDLYVSVNSGSDANAGTAPGSAFKTIGKALATAGDGTHIHIEAGNYGTNTETFPLNAANKFGLQLLGTNSAATMLTAKGAAARALTMSSCYPDARIEGLTLANASWAKDAADGVGGGVWLSHVAGAVVSCAITNNALNDPNGWTAPSGGGICTMSGSVLLSNCVIRGNSVAPWYAGAGYGGGLFASGGQGVLANCEISGNIAGPQGSSQGNVQGGGLYLNGNFSLRNCLIFTNDVIPYTTPSSTAVGAGVCVAGGVVVFENCTIATNKGEGIRQIGGTVAVSNSILWGNTVDLQIASGRTGALASDDERGVLNLSAGTATVGSAVIGATAGVGYGILALSNTMFIVTDSFTLNTTASNSISLGSCPKGYDVQGTFVDAGGRINVSFLAAPALNTALWAIRIKGDARATLNGMIDAGRLTSTGTYAYKKVAVRYDAVEGYTYYAMTDDAGTWGMPAVDQGAGPVLTSDTTATLRGRLLGGGAAYVSVAWGTNAVNLEHTNTVGMLPEGAFSVAVAELRTESDYYYRCFASNANGQAWAPQTTRFTPLLRETLALEQNAEFAKAVTVATALLNQSTGVQRRSELRDIVSRLRQQKQIANNLSSAIAALAINRDIAERELQAEPEVAVLLLRQAVRHQDGAVLDNAVAILHSMNDAEVPALLVDRIRTCKDPTVGLALVTHLERVKDRIAPELAPACRAAMQQAGLADTPAGRAVLAGCAALPGDRKE